MSNLQMKLNTGETIPIKETGYEHIVVLCDSLEEFRQIHDAMLAGAALDSVEITANGEPIATITGMRIAGTQTVSNLDGTVTGHFYTAGGTYELGGDYAEAARILLGEE